MIYEECGDHRGQYYTRPSFFIFLLTVRQIRMFLFSLKLSTAQGQSSLKISAHQSLLFQRSQGTNKHTDSLTDILLLLRKDCQRSHCILRRGKMSESPKLVIDIAKLIQYSNLADNNFVRKVLSADNFVYLNYTIVSSLYRSKTIQEFEKRAHDGYSLWILLLGFIVLCPKCWHVYFHDF